MDPVIKAIRKHALSYVGERELKNNSGFVSINFEKIMLLTGWRKGYAWCAFFGELIWKLAGLDEAAKLFSGSAVQTWKNFVASPFFETSDTPAVGDIVVWQTYRNGIARWTGHLGVVVSIDHGQVISVEGNTDSEGGREGIEVSLKAPTRGKNVNNGLRRLGYIKPIIIRND